MALLRVASMNLRKRGNSPSARPALESWLEWMQPDLLILQEPVARSAVESARFPGYELVLGSPLLAAYVREAWPERRLVSAPSFAAERWLSFACGSLEFHGLYLSPDSAPARRTLLQEVAQGLRKRTGLQVVVGDFNMAPGPMDGIFGDAPSKFTTVGERVALQGMLTGGGLCDLWEDQRGASTPFTFERITRGKPLRFRCDLALASRSLAADPRVKLFVDHSVRKGLHAFTDHSAICLEIPCPPGAPARDIRPEATAITRRPGEKSPVMHLFERGLLSPEESVLDFGCGRGADGVELRRVGFRVEGYDPSPTFEQTTRPNGLFDLVLCSYVVNVLPGFLERMATLCDAWSYVRPGGRLLLVSRTVNEIRRNAEAGWTRHNDGYLTSRHTFQKGHAPDELLQMAGRLEDVEIVERASLPSGGACAVIAHRARP